MANTSLRIERLVVRVRGLDETGARELALRLGPVVLRELAPNVLRMSAGDLHGVERIDAGRVTFAGAERTATKVAAAITARLPLPGRS
jgi:hypothetical protein